MVPFNFCKSNSKSFNDLQLLGIYLFKAWNYKTRQNLQKNRIVTMKLANQKTCTGGVDNLKL